MSERSVGLASVILRAVEQGKVSLRVAMPATIKTFDAASQLASVEPALDETHEGEDGELITEPLPVISDVPVQFPGAGGFVITFPVAAGDSCFLVFSDRSIDKWIESGKRGDPIDLRRHHLSDAVAILGVRSKAAALAEFEAGNARFGKVGGPGVTVRTDGVHLGVLVNEVATDAVIRGTARNTAEQTFLTALNTFAVALNAYALAIKAVADPSNVATPTFTAAQSAFTLALNAFKTAATAALSATTKVK